LKLISEVLWDVGRVLLPCFFKYLYLHAAIYAFVRLCICFITTQRSEIVKQ
jgi:hypothetical protein